MLRRRRINQRRQYGSGALRRFRRSKGIITKSNVILFSGGLQPYRAHRISKDRLACKRGEIVNRQGMCDRPPKHMTVTSYNKQYRKEEDEALKLLQSQADTLITNHQKALDNLSQYMQRIASITEAKKMATQANKVHKAVQKYMTFIGQCAKGNAQNLTAYELVRCMNRKKLMQDSKPLIDDAVKQMKKLRELVKPLKTWKRAALYRAQQIATVGAKAAVWVMKKLWEYRDYLTFATKIYTIGPKIATFVIDNLSNGTLSSAMSIIIQGVATYFCVQIIDKKYGLSRLTTWLVTSIFNFMWSKINVLLSICKKMAKKSSSFLKEYSKSFVDLIEDLQKENADEFNTNVEMASYASQHVGSIFVTKLIVYYFGEDYASFNLLSWVQETLVWLCSTGVTFIAYLFAGVIDSDLVNSITSTDGLKKIDYNASINEQFAALLGETTSLIATGSDLAKIQASTQKAKSKIKQRESLSDGDNTLQKKRLKKYASQNHEFLNARHQNIHARAKNFVENTATTYAGIKAVDTARKTLTGDASGALGETYSVDSEDVALASSVAALLTSKGEFDREKAARERDKQTNKKLIREQRGTIQRKMLVRNAKTYKESVLDTTLNNLQEAVSDKKDAVTETASDWGSWLYDTAASYVTSEESTKQRENLRAKEREDRKRQKELKSKKRSETKMMKKSKRIENEKTRAYLNAQDTERLKSEELKLFDATNEDGTLNIPIQKHEEAENPLILKTAKKVKQYAEQSNNMIQSGTTFLKRTISNNQTMILAYAIFSIGALGFAKYQGHKIKKVLKEIESLSKEDAMKFTDLFDVTIDQPLSPVEMNYFTNNLQSRRKQATTQDTKQATTQATTQDTKQDTNQDTLQLFGGENGRFKIVYRMKTR